VYIDERFVTHKIPVMPNHLTLCNLNAVVSGKDAALLVLISCFLDGNMTQTISDKYRKNRSSGFPMGCAVAAAEDGKVCSNVYKVNM
jgi:hypothetical protein